MCGIVGFVDSHPKKKKEEIIHRMAKKIQHRGPDSEGIYADSHVALGHRRLSIIDLKGGEQPIWNESHDKAVVFNGEIYNYKELREELEAKGHVFKTKTDTEVLLHGYEEYQEDLFLKLRGMFAFVIYDAKTKEIIGARDPFGIKPLYYYHDQAFMFSSEIKSFLEHPDFHKEVNTDALKMYLIFQYSVHEETFFKRVFKLKPGHYFKYKDQQLEIKEYFHVRYEKGKESFDHYQKELEKVLKESIHAHQIASDVEVGSYLSGGVDSSYVVGVARPDKTFTVGFDVRGFDETKMAQDLSQILGIQNKSRYVSADDFFSILPIIAYHTDEPHANLSTVPLYFLSKLAHEDVKVVLSGEGSDEMFGGYLEYLEPLSLRMYTKIPLFLRKGLAKILRPLPHFPGKNTLILYSKPFYERYIGHGSYISEEEANMILAESLRSDETIGSLIKPLYEDVKHENDVIKKMYIDMFYWLPQDILLKADKMSMANSVELRVPLLDLKVFDVARKIPAKYMVRDKQTKYLFRKIAEEEMPEEWSQRKKLGFPVPLGKWLREEKYYQLVKDKFHQSFVSSFFNVSYLDQLLDDHYQDKKKNGLKIYIILMFIIWYEVYFEEEVKSCTSSSVSSV